jgi:asparagine synthase (glutamine-hydrolysing)
MKCLQGDGRQLFLAMICVKDDLPSWGGHRDELWGSVAGIEPLLSFETASFSGYLAAPDPRIVVSDGDRGVVLVLYGEVYGSPAGDCPPLLLKQYLRGGLEELRDVNGSCAILLIDQMHDIVALITDRLNTRKVFYSSNNGGHWLSNSMLLHPLGDIALDVSGVASYLASGAVHNNRTLFQGVRVMDRACVHILHRGGFHPTQYWTYEFTGEHAAVAEDELRNGFENMLVEGVERRLCDYPRVFLSLSGGYDSSAILGILAGKLEYQEVKCFSYSLGEPAPGSDCLAAREMARLVGYPHESLVSYQGDLPGAIRQNARHGQGLAFFCDEIDVWMELGERVRDLQGTEVLFVGDTCLYAWGEPSARSYREALLINRVNDFDALSWLSDHIHASAYAALSGGLQEDIDDMVGRLHPGDTPLYATSFFYLDQRLSHVILPWREYFCGQSMAVRNPFLDNAVLDFMKGFPFEVWERKRLFKETVTGMFPGLFQIERAAFGAYVPDWTREFVRWQRVIESIIRSEDSALDELVPPEAIVRILSLLCEDRAPSKGDRMRGYLSRRMPILSQAASRLRASRGTRPRREIVSAGDLLKRLLVLRSFISYVDKTPPYIPGGISR